MRDTFSRFVSTFRRAEVFAEFSSPSRGHSVRSSMLFNQTHINSSASQPKQSRRGLGLLASLLIAAGLAGCATTSTSSSYSSRAADNVGYTGPAKDKVLWEYRNALVSMRNGQYVRAKELLDDAILTMGGIITSDKSARKARGYFHGESKKNFIGEPYERVMAFYYRGILYWMDGEPDNARACFRSAQFIDSDAENKKYAADYALLDYLEAVATKKLAGDGSDAFERAKTISRHPLAEVNPKANVLVFLEFGRGPSKYSGGEYGQHLMFSEGRSSAKGAIVKCAGQSASAYAYDDLYFQATTRGGRVMDHILANKAGFKTATDAAGTAGIVSGAVLATRQGRNSNADEVGAGLLAFGLLSKLVSSATTPTADVRCWDNLPQYLSFAAMEVPAGTHALTVEFRNQGGYVIPSLTKTVNVNVTDPTRDLVLFISDQATVAKAL